MGGRARRPVSPARQDGQPPKGSPGPRCRPPDIGSAPQVFALIVFACLVGDGYTSLPEDPKLFCIFNGNEDACRYGIGIGVLAFLACIFFFMVDVYFPQISNTMDRKYLVLADLGFSGTRGAGLCLLWPPQWPPCPVTWLPVPGEGSRSRLALCPRATRCCCC